MDFLDPVKRRRHSRRLIFGYILVGALILIIGRFFVIWASGETINPRTGKITDYGLLFVDSKPSGASIYLNNQSQGTTSARLNLAAGTYSLQLKKDGYYDWNNKLTLAGQSVDRAVYPLLFPKSPKSSNLKSYAALPSVVSTSRDRHWLLIEQVSSPANFSFDVYDTTKPTLGPSALPVPTSLLDNTTRPNQALSVVEWASDNNHMLLKHSFDGGAEFIIFSRTDSAGNLNLNRQFKLAATSASLNNGRADQIFLYSSADRAVYLANTSRNNLTPEIQKVNDWKNIDSDLVLYYTTDGAPPGQITYKIWDNGKNYKLTDQPVAEQQLFDAHSYQSHWYYALGNNVLGRVVIYQDPLDSLKNPSSGKARPLLSITTPGSPSLSFSDHNRFIEAKSGQQFNIYDTETQTRYKYFLSLTPSPALDWMDAYRLVGNIDNQVFVMDFDAQNQHKLIPTASGAVEFDGPYNHMYSFGLPADDGSIGLQITDLRAGNDLPKQ